jgi:guanylate kinase
VLPRFPELQVAVSATTRRIRPGEVDGEHYHFLTPEEFAERVRDGQFLEHVTYAGNRYGTMRSEVDRILSLGRSPVVEIELAGARAVRRMVPDAVSVFIAPPSWQELSARLERRATDTEGEIAERLRTGEVELAARDEFDHVVVNEDVEAAVDDLARIVRAATRPADG